MKKLLFKIFHKRNLIYQVKFATPEEAREKRAKEWNEAREGLERISRLCDKALNGAQLMVTVKNKKPF